MNNNNKPLATLLGLAMCVAGLVGVFSEVVPPWLAALLILIGSFNVSKTRTKEFMKSLADLIPSFRGK